MSKAVTLLHSIRLLGPWQYQAGNLSGSVHLTREECLPLASDFQGTVTMQRRFGAPSGVAPYQSIYLVIETAWSLDRMELNGRLLQGEPHVRTEQKQVRQYQINVTKQLQEKNLLTLQFRVGLQEGAAGARDQASVLRLLDHVCLEIRAE